MAECRALSWLARRVVTARWPYVVRQGVANLYRPANQTSSVVLALGFGAFLVSTLYLVQANLLKQFEVTAMQSKSNLIFFDIQDDQRPGLDSILKSEGQRRARIYTDRHDEDRGDKRQTTARWAASQGISANNWALRREFRSTYRDTMVATEKLVEGKWFGETTQLPDSLTELSFEQSPAQELHVKLGDVITWDVQGVKVATKLTSIREVNWGRFEPNFFAVLQQKALKDAPKSFATVAAVPSDSMIARLQRGTGRALSEYLEHGSLARAAHGAGRSSRRSPLRCASSRCSASRWESRSCSARSPRRGATGCAKASS